MIMRLVALASLCVVTTASAAASIHHVPPADVTAGQPLELVVDAPPATPTLTLHYRPTGSGPFQTLELVRKGDAQWVAIVPADKVEVPGIDYFLASGGQPVFASPALPHTMPVVATAASERRARDLVRHKTRRYRIETAFDYVTYGARTEDGVRFVDRYGRLDAAFAYRLWAYPLEEIRVGYTGLLGNTQSRDVEVCTDAGAAPPCNAQAGFKVGGWFELGLAAVEGFRFDGRVIVMANQEGFQPGTRLETRLGVREGSHVAVGLEYLANVGTSGFFRLGWGTVPSAPMAATVEITNAPSSDRPTGVRLYYDISHAFDNGFRLGARVGYAARIQSTAGFTGGATASVDF